MFISACIQPLQGFLCCCFQCSCADGDIQSITTTSSQQPLLGRDTPMPPHRTYGTKRSTTSAAASAIFGREESIPAAPRQPLADLTAQFANSLTISDNASTADTEDYEADERTKTLSAPSSAKTDNVRHSEDSHTLQPLIDAYFTDRGTTMTVQDWDIVLPPNSTLEKIAEASFAEVYRVTTADGRTSILKIMQLKVSTDAASIDMKTAIPVETVISEIRIMNALTEVPGFVTFKDAHLIQGKPGLPIKQAYEDHRENLISLRKDSDFPDPDDFTPDSTFLVIELGDAGVELEICALESVEKVWDIFLGIVIALARAELSNEFEHRDLHQSNICVQQKPPSSDPSLANGTLKFGFSGLEITIIDYGLSRAKLPSDDIAFYDLEQDLSFFHGAESGGRRMHADAYRRMRTHLFTGTRTMFPAEWHDASSRSENNGHTWADFTPYSNVIWLRYLLSYLTKACKKDLEGSFRAMMDFERETRELQSKLNVRTLKENGAFMKAQDVLEYVAQKGWVSEEQLVESGVDTTFMSEPATEEN